MVDSRRPRVPDTWSGPVSLDELIETLQLLRAQHGGSIPVHILTVQDSFEDKPAGEIQVCEVGQSIMILPQWGPIQEIDDAPKRLVITSE